jgi:hypothetical protein
VKASLTLACGLVVTLALALAIANDHDRRRRSGGYAKSPCERRQPAHPAMLPEFVARDFYDR